MKWIFRLLLMVTVLYSVSFAGINEELFNAVKSNNLAGVQLLIEKGADVNAKNEFDDSPLGFAAWAGAFDIVKLLIDKGADINIKDNRGDSPLVLADRNNQKEVVKLLTDLTHIGTKSACKCT